MKAIIEDVKQLVHDDVALILTLRVDEHTALGIDYRTAFSLKAPDKIVRVP